MPEKGWYSLTVRKETAVRVRELTRNKGLTVDELLNELMRGRSIFYEHLPEDVLVTLEDSISEQPRYLIRGVPGILNARWRLYVPEGFKEKLRGI